MLAIHIFIVSLYFLGLGLFFRGLFFLTKIEKEPKKNNFRKSVILILTSAIMLLVVILSGMELDHSFIVEHNKVDKFFISSD